MKNILRLTISIMALCAMALGANAHAQDRKAYRIVDAKGNVTYSQTPPVDGKDAKPVDISPAQRGRGGDVSGYGVYDNPYYRGNDRYTDYSATAPRASAYEQRPAELKAQCERQRGTDCNDPAALRYRETTSIPGQVVRRPLPRHLHAPNTRHNG